jgi:hypothetical protein
LGGLTVLLFYTPEFGPECGLAHALHKWLGARARLATLKEISGTASAPPAQGEGNRLAFSR